MSPIFPTRYQFLIDGEVSDRVKAAFPQLQVGRSVGGFTTLFGLVSDHSSLRSIMARLDALGLTLAELRRCRIEFSRVPARGESFCMDGEKYADTGVFGAGIRGYACDAAFSLAWGCRT